MTKLHELSEIGQTIWYDNIQRSIIDSGELQALLDSGVMGVTSNPSIFEKAIGGSADYDDAIQTLVQEGKGAEEIMDALIGKATVNTVPPATLAEFLEHGAVAERLGDGLSSAHKQLSQLADLGIDLDSITQKLQDDGVDAFARSFESLIASVASKKEQFQRMSLGM